MPGMRPAVFVHPPFPGHQLLDSGDGEKLERFGEVILVRPDPQALWSPRLAADEWRAADLTFVRESDRGGRWEAGGGDHPAARAKAPEWTVDHEGARFLIRPTPFKHVGLFPEQAVNWEWIQRQAVGFEDEPPRVLNLFGYTGAASLVAARAGCRVTHVDASKASLAWARDNAAGSDIEQGQIRFLLEDARTFASREVRRGNRYEGILIDPPHYGRGPKGEKWQFEDHIAELVQDAAKLVTERAFVCLSAYAIGLLPTALVNLLGALEGGDVEAGELALPEMERPDAGPVRLLSSGMCARWRRGG